MYVCVCVCMYCAICMLYVSVVCDLVWCVTCLVCDLPGVFEMTTRYHGMHTNGTIAIQAFMHVCHTFFF